MIFIFQEEKKKKEKTNQFHRRNVRRLVRAYSRERMYIRVALQTARESRSNRHDWSPRGSIFVVKYLSRSPLPSVLLWDVSLPREKNERKTEGASETEKGSESIDSTCTRASFLIFQWASYAPESSALSIHPARHPWPLDSANPSRTFIPLQPYHPLPARLPVSRYIYIFS